MILDQDHPADQDLHADQDHPANLYHPGISAEHVLDPSAQHQVPPGHPTLPLLSFLPGLKIMTTMAITMTKTMLLHVVDHDGNNHDHDDDDVVAGVPGAPDLPL